MSGRVEIEGTVPRPETILGILDEEARASVQQSGQILVDHIHLEAPGSGRLVEAFAPRLGKTATGQQVTVQPNKRKVIGVQGQTAAKVVRWVTRGTGIYRTSGTGSTKLGLIRGKRGPMVLPGGKRRYTVRGQRPNPFFTRAAERAQADVERELTDGRDRAARRLERLL